MGGEGDQWVGRVANEWKRRTSGWSKRGTCSWSKGIVGGSGCEWVEEGANGWREGQWVEVGSFPPAVLYVKVRLSCLKALPSFGGVKSLPSCKNVFGKLSN